MTDIKSLDLEELTEYIEDLGEKKFRAKQIYKWLHQDFVTGFDEMTNIPKDLRDRLKEDACIYVVKPVKVILCINAGWIRETAYTVRDAGRGISYTKGHRGKSVKYCLNGKRRTP